MGEVECLRGAVISEISMRNLFLSVKATHLYWSMINWVACGLRLKIQMTAKLLDILITEQYLKSLPGRVHTWMCHQQSPTVAINQGLEAVLPRKPPQSCPRTAGQSHVQKKEPTYRRTKGQWNSKKEAKKDRNTRKVLKRSNGQWS